MFSDTSDFAKDKLVLGKEPPGGGVEIDILKFKKFCFRPRI